MVILFHTSIYPLTSVNMRCEDISWRVYIVIESDYNMYKSKRTTNHAFVAAKSTQHMINVLHS